MTLAGCKNVTMRIGETELDHVIHFTEDKCTPAGPNSYEIILGNDALARLPNFHLDYQQGVFHCGDEQIPLGRNPGLMNISNADEVAIRVGENTVVPPLTDAFVACTVNSRTQNVDLVLMSQASKITQLDLLVAPAIISSECPYIMISNPTNEPKKLFKGMKISTAALTALDGQCI